MLYVLKLFSFKHFKQDHKKIYDRIMSILKRIVILTILYEITVAWCMIAGLVRVELEHNEHETHGDEDHVHEQIEIGRVLWITSWLIASVVASYSIFLMQSHNENQYQHFLKIMFKAKIYHICCGCKEIFIQASEDRKSTLKIKPSALHPHRTVDTQDASVKHKHSVFSMSSATVDTNVDTNVDNMSA